VDGAILGVLNATITAAYRQSTVKSLPLIETDRHVSHNIILNSTVKNNSCYNVANSLNKLLRSDSFFNDLKTVLRRHPVALMIAVTYVT
jgi:hypothetical protein